MEEISINENNNVYKEIESNMDIRGVNVNYVILNGKLTKKEEANISVFNKAMFFNFAVYDSMKVVKGESFFPEFHVDRLIESAKIIKLEHKFTKEEVLQWIEMLIEKNNLHDAMIRFLLLGAGGPQEEPQLFLFPVGLTFYRSGDYNRGVKAITFHGERPIPQSKSKDLLINFMALREAIHQDAKDALLVDSGGCIREGTRTNFFAVKNGKIYTAPLTEVLEGVTRKIVIKLAKENNIEVIEKKIKVSKLKEYDEFFFTSTSMNVLPIAQIDDYEIPGNVGTTTKKLIKLFKNYYRKEVFQDENAE
jgi:branched-chain amino acid aminotransferase